MASGGASDATDDGETMAQLGLPSLLALKVERPPWPASGAERDAEFD
jgi:hypothetical protein